MNTYLTSDCSNCFGLCCVALPYAKSSDFAFNKDGGDPCRNLSTDNRCGIHDQLRDKGFRGCVSYECFGAGQHVSQQIYNGNHWRDNKKVANEMFTVFPIVQQLYEMLNYLSQALDRNETKSFHKELKAAYNETIQLTNKTPQEILNLDVHAHRSTVNTLLIRTSEAVRKEFVQQNKKRKNNKAMDYLGANLKGANLRGETLRGTLLIAANLRNADLRKVDFIGADLRDTDLSNADLTDCLFLTQSQVNAAKGNNQTKLPAYVNRPQHWME